MASKAPLAVYNGEIQQLQSGDSLVDASGAAYAIPIVGVVQMYAGAVQPTGWLFCDGSSVSRSTYASLFAVLYPYKGNPTISIASPGVVTLNAHGLTNGTPVFFETTGALPTGLVVRTVYYVVSAAANTFQVSATAGGSSINTSGAQSGTHSLYVSPYPAPASGTTFYVPDLRGRSPVGAGAGTGLTTRALGATGGAETHQLVTGEIPAHNHTDSGHTHSATGLSTANESAHTHATASGASYITGTGGGNTVASGSGGVTWSATSNTGTGSAHNHTITGSTASSNAVIGNTGGGGAHNNMHPWASINFIIKT